MRLFVPVVLAAHVVAASEPVPVFRAFRLFAYSRPHLLNGGTSCRYVAGVGRNGAAPTAGSLSALRLGLYCQRSNPSPHRVAISSRVADQSGTGIKGLLSLTIDRLECFEFSGEFVH